MNLFSVCLCALLMNGALLYTTLLPLQTHLKVAKEMMAISDTEHVTDTVNGACYINQAQYTQPHFIYNARNLLQQNISVQKVLGDTKMSSWLVFCLK